MRTGYSKSEKMDPRVRKSEAKGTKSEPRDTNSEPKGSQKWANGSQGATKMHQKIDLRKRSRKSEALGGYQHQILEPFWEPFFIKNRWTNRCENQCRKSHEFHEKSMRNLDVFWIEVLRKIGSVRKVLNADKLIKTNGFFMISWFARFKHRFGKLQKNMKKGLEQVVQKTLENH